MIGSRLVTDQQHRRGKPNSPRYCDRRSTENLQDVQTARLPMSPLCDTPCSPRGTQPQRDSGRLLSGSRPDGNCRNSLAAAQVRLDDTHCILILCVFSVSAGKSWGVQMSHLPRTSSCGIACNPSGIQMQRGLDPWRSGIRPDGNLSNPSATYASVPW